MTEALSNRWDPKLVAVAASLLLSLFAWAMAVLPNDDAYVYVRTAEIYLQDGLAAAFEHYGWAGYSILIGELSRTGLGLFESATLINALLFALLVYAFVSLVALLDGSRLTLGLAVLTILLYPELNEFRFFIIRDIGFWAFMLFGLLLFIRFVQRPGIASAIAVTAALLIAALFRAEAVVYLLCLPLALLWQQDLDWQARRARLLTLGGTVAAALLLCVAVLFLAGFNALAMLTDFFSVYLPFVQANLSPGEARSTELGRLLFGEHAANFSQAYMTGVIAAGLLVILFMTLFAGLSGQFFFLLLYGAWRRQLKLTPATRSPFLVTIAVNFLILLVFLYVTRFLSSRYAIILCLLLATQVPLVIRAWIEHSARKRWARLSRSLVVLFFAYCAFDAYVSFGYPRDYLTDSVDFIEERLATEQSLLTNNHTVAYRSGRVVAYDEVQRLITLEAIREMQEGDLLAVEMIYDMQQLLATEGARSLLRFEQAYPEGAEARMAIYRRLPD